MRGLGGKSFHSDAVLAQSCGERGFIPPQTFHHRHHQIALKREIAAMESDLDPRLQAKVQELHALTLALGGQP